MIEINLKDYKNNYVAYQGELREVFFIPVSEEKKIKELSKTRIIYGTALGKILDEEKYPYWLTNLIKSELEYFNKKIDTNANEYREIVESIKKFIESLKEDNLALFLDKNIIIKVEE